MRVAIIVMNDMTSDARAEREARSLAEAGHDVAVLALRREGLPVDESRDGYAVRRAAAFTSATWRRPLLKARQSRRRTRDLCDAALAWSAEVVHAHDLDSLPAAVRAKEASGCRVVYDAGEVFSDMLVANRPSVPRAVLAYWDALERRLVRKADAVLTVSDAIAEELERRTGVHVDALLNVPPLEPLPRSSPLRGALGVGDDAFVVLYQGLVNIGRALLPMVDAVAELPSAVLAVQGYGPLVAEVLSHARDRGVADRVRYLEAVPIAELNTWAAGADVGDVVLENLSLNNYLAAPNKLFQYMMAGLPILASDFPEMRRIVEGEGIGLLCDPADPASIADALRRLQADPDARREMGVRARALAETRYNWDVEKRKLLDVYERLGERV